MHSTRFIGFNRFIGFIGFWFIGFWFIGFWFIGFTGSGFTGFGSPVSAQEHQHAPAPMRPMTSRAAVKGHTGPLPPLPYEGYPSPRPMAVTQAAYEFAARHPEVLQFIPCFCGCERSGHGGNHDCFVRSRDPQGKVTWDSHGYGCAICIDVAYSAMQMHNSGASVSQIRTAIDQKYAGRFPTATPTPKPSQK